MQAEAEATARLNRLVFQVKNLREQMPELVDALQATLRKPGIDLRTKLQQLDDVVAARFPKLVGKTADARAFLENWAAEEVRYLDDAVQLGVVSPQMRKELMRWHRPAHYEAPQAPTTRAAEVRIGEAGAATYRRGWLEAHHVPEGWEADLPGAYRVMGPSGGGRRAYYLQNLDSAKKFVERRGGDVRRALAGDGPWEILQPTARVVQDLGALSDDAVMSRLKSLQAMMQSVTQAKMLHTLRKVSGLVLDEGEAMALPRTVLLDTYRQLPTTKSFGPLGGMYVNRHALNSIASHSRYSTWLRNLFEDWNAEIAAGGGLGIRLLGNSGISSSKVYRAVRGVALTSWITANPITWASNVAFNVATGTLGLRVAPWKIFTPTFWRGLKRFRSGDPAFLELAKKGLVLDANVFTGHLDDAAAAPLDRLQHLLEGSETTRLGQRLARLKTMDTSTLSATQLTERANRIAVLERQTSRSFFRTMQKAVKGIQDAGSHAYGLVDTAMKAGYANVLLSEGMDAAKVAGLLGDFMQNYAAVPPAVRWLGQNPLGSMVTSFPYEWLRIGTNMLRQRPIELALGASALLNWNQAQLAGNGLTMEQYAAAQGGRNSYQHMWNLATSIVTPGGFTIDLSNMLGTNMFSMPTGLLRQASLDLAKHDTAGATIASAAMNIAGRFVLNNPLIGLGVAVGLNRDQFADRPLTDSNATPQDKFAAKAAWAFKTIMPPWMPGGAFGGIDGYQAEVLGREYDAKAGRLVPLWERLLRTAGVRRTLPAHSVYGVVAEAAKLTYRMNNYQVPLYGSTKDNLDAAEDIFVHGMHADADVDVLREKVVALRDQMLGQSYVETIDGEERVVQREIDGVNNSLERLARGGGAGLFSKLPVYAQAYALRRMVESGLARRDPAAYSQLLGVHLLGPGALLPSQSLGQLAMTLASGHVRAPADWMLKRNDVPSLVRALDELTRGGGAPSPELNVVALRIVERIRELAAQ